MNHTQSGLWQESMTLDNNGNVGIGTANPGYKLDVNGIIRTNEIKVTAGGGADFVFEEDYNLLSLKQVEQHIKENKHLPGIPPAKKLTEEGVSLGDMQTKLLQKIEELTLYTLQQQKQIKMQQKRIEELEKRMSVFK